MRVKRVLDVVAAVALLALTAPLLALAALAVRVAMGRPIVFRQVRIGRAERPFVLLKLRTMRASPAATAGISAGDGARLTDLGRRLRALGVDELPQLWNVLRGEMSLVGPRPLLPEYLPRYTPTERRRHEVLPGLTGLVQVSGRNGLGWRERLALDVWYVEHRSLRLDLAILCRTPLVVLRGTGASAPGHATMPELGGEA